MSYASHASLITHVYPTAFTAVVCYVIVAGLLAASRVLFLVVGRAVYYFMCLYPNVDFAMYSTGIWCTPTFI